MQTPEHDPIGAPLAAATPESTAIAPAWHTWVLLAGILALSANGASRLSVLHGSFNRLAAYGLTSAMELAMLGWVLLGLRLKKTPLRSLTGKFAKGLRGVAADCVIAAVFWFGSLMVLGSLALSWDMAQNRIYYRSHASQAGQTHSPMAERQKVVERMARLAPANGAEVAGWFALSMLAGFCEEIVFRGYLQRQFTAWTGGRVAVGVLFSALCFGAAHGYQGVRGMFLITVFGALFSLLALYRRNLRAGIFAHGWHDFIAGLALALLKSRHFI
jgi:membrane protease YdiL (CAAX protease family)